MNSAIPHFDAEQWFTELRKIPANAARWDWYTLLRVIQAQADLFPPIGYSIQLAKDPVRLGQPPFMHPPQTTVASLKFTGPREAGAPKVAEGRIPWINSYHFGLFGPRGPLPVHLTEHAYTNNKAGDLAFSSFCNVLHHRFSCFFFRAWADSRKEVDLDRRRADSGESDKDFNYITWEFFIGCLIGVGLPAMRGLDSIPHRAKLYYSGRLLAKTKNLEGLETILEDFFESPVKVIPFRPTTSRIPEEARWKLGGGLMTGYLGRSTLAGETIKNVQDGFRIRIGPVRKARFEEFLPINQGFAQLRDWIRLYVGRETDPNEDYGIEAAWDLQLVLDHRDVPPMKLGGGVRLGWTTWLHSEPPRQDITDLVIRPSSKPPLVMGGESATSSNSANL